MILVLITCKRGVKSFESFLRKPREKPSKNLGRLASSLVFWIITTLLVLRTFAWMPWNAPLRLPLALLTLTLALQALSSRWVLRTLILRTTPQLSLLKTTLPPEKIPLSSWWKDFRAFIYLVVVMFYFYFYLYIYMCVCVCVCVCMIHCFGSFEFV